MADKTTPTTDTFDTVQEAPSLLGTGEAPTETIDLNSIFGGDTAIPAEPEPRKVDTTPVGKLLQAMPIPAILVDKNGFVFFVNDSCAKIGPAYRSLLGGPFSNLFADPDVVKKADLLIERVVTTRKPKVAEGRLELAGVTAWGRMHFRSFRVGKERSILVLIEDLAAGKEELNRRKKNGDRTTAAQEGDTSRYRPEASSGEDTTERRFEDRYAEVCRRSSNAVAVVDERDGEVLYANAAVEKLLGYDPNRFMSGNFSVCLPKGQSAAGWLQNVCLRGVLGEQIELISSDGDETLVELTAGPLPWDGRPAVGLTMKPAARASAPDCVEGFSRTLIESSPVGIIVCDRLGNVTEANERSLKMLGQNSVEEAKALNLLTYSPLLESGVSSLIGKCIESGDPVVSEFPQKVDGAKQFYVRLRVAPVRGEDGRVTGAQAVVEDISDQKRAERRLLQSERLKAVGEMSGAVAESFNGFVQKVAGDSRQALGLLESRNITKIRPLLEEIFDGSRDAVQTVRRLHQFSQARRATGVSRWSRSHRDVFDLTDTVRDAVEKSRIGTRSSADKRGVEIKVKLDLRDGCFIKGDEADITEVILNLLKNAEEALPVGGTVQVKTTFHKENVVLKIEDDGIGIPEENMGRVFEPFWTTKEAHKGMGLTICFGIVRRHSGTVTLTSRTRRGTGFVVRIPAAKRPSAGRRAATPAAPDNSFRILLIDDDEPIVRIFEKGLRKLGQTPIPALSGQEGIKIFEETEVDAVVSDLAMPGMNGWEVARAIHEICLEKGIPKPPFILVTGWAGQIAEEEIIAHPDVDRIVEKPLKVPRLLEIVANRIKGASADTTVSGVVNGIDLLDYIQLVMLTGKPVVVEVRQRNGLLGHIFLERGTIVHAACGDLEGEHALYKCLSFEGGSFSNLPWRRPDKITIDKPGEYLLLEACRRRDEQREQTMP